MELIEFPEQTIIVAKDQPEYNPMPAFIQDDDVGTLVCCWHLTLKERIKLLWTGKLWHTILTFKRSVQPQRLEVNYPFIKTKAKGTSV